MTETRKYTIDMARLRLGVARGFEVGDGFLACNGNASFVSGRFDGGSKNNEWGRLRLTIKVLGDCSYSISVCASNSGAEPNDSDWDNEKACCRMENLSELLLGKVKGRYLWFRLDVNGAAALYGGALYTFGAAFEDYLPQIYSMGREHFSHRYLSLFFTAYSELREYVDGFGANLDAQNAPDSFLPLIAQWMGLGGICGLVSADELRRFLPHGRYLSRYRGTRRAVLLIAELLTGKRPVLLEQMKIRKNTALPYADTYNRLYGETEKLVFLVFFESLDHGVCMRLQRLADMFAPVGNGTRLVVKPDSVILDGYTYLDYNAGFMPESGGRASNVKADEGYVLLE